MRKILPSSFLIPGLVLLSGPILSAQGPVPYDRQAQWESYTGGVTTGGGFADINGDGFLDFVVANGNDILRQRVEVYYNDGQGGFPNNPQWQSSDVDYHGHLAIGDINQDGWPDVAVSVFLGAGGFGSLGKAKVYMNTGGSLENSPSWTSSDRFYSFSCALGDADGDGDLDLAVATGEPYFGSPTKNRIYYNSGGTLGTSPGWQAAINDHALDVAFGDADGDGDQDLAFCTASGPNRIYFQTGSGMSTSAGWSSTDNNNQNGNTLAFHDYDSDGDQDLAVSDNDQLSGGQGDFKIYRNLGSGLATTPFWTDYNGMVSAVAWADVHLDGQSDLFGGVWWGGTMCFLNNNGSFSHSRSWDSSKNSVVEAISFGDIDANALRDANSESHAPNGRCYYLNHRPVHAIQEIRVDGSPLALNNFCANLEEGWIALDRTPSANVEIDYTWTESPDMGVTNWDQSIGNLLFLRHDLIEVDAIATGSTNLSPGGTLNLDVDIQSTTNRTENIRVAVVTFPPNQVMRILDLRNESLAPFAGSTTPHSFPVPSSLPPGFLGQYTLTAATLYDSDVIATDSFNFSIQ
ncbi:MAG: VCBS repeat-containing protein [Planctomycetota bacterium]|nr:MAG: VCBS repeat-containing protein [Planctomycetota bacterium]